MSSVDRDAERSRISEPARRAAASAHRRRRTPVTWVRGGGLTTLLFLLPMLLVFGAFSWYPIVRTVVMSLQHTNLVAAGDAGSGSTTSATSSTTRCCRPRSRTPPYFARLALSSATRSR